MAADKRRFVGPSGAIFVPNVPDDTIEVMVASGEWTPLAEPAKPEPKRPRSRKAKED